MQTRSTMLLVFLCLFFAAQGISAAGFNVDFVKRPPLLTYSKSYDNYELILELKITEVGDQSPGDKRVVTKMTVRADRGSGDFGATMMARVLSGGTDGQLVFLCRSLLRCLYIRNKIATSPSFIQQAVEFTPFGVHAGLPTQFESVRSAILPEPGPVIQVSALDHSEMVFQRHLDNSLPFAQNWETYEKGFGDPSGNYWIGLEQLSALTKDSNCKLTMEGTLFNGSVLSSTFKDFQVRGADENYKLRVGDKVSGGLIDGMNYHDQMEFSTYDREHDKRPSSSCSKVYAAGAGWWFNSCKMHNPNGPILSEVPTNSKCADSCMSWYGDVADPDGQICWKSTKLSFRCS